MTCSRGGAGVACLPPAVAAQVSHMRGKIADMDAIVAHCESRGVYLIEDCAHSIGVRAAAPPHAPPPPLRLFLLLLLAEGTGRSPPSPNAPPYTPLHPCPGCALLGPQVLWKGRHTGHHGRIACISSQSYKMLNSGEGGFLLTNDAEAGARAAVYAGAYEALHKKHTTARRLLPPSPPQHCKRTHVEVHREGQKNKGRLPRRSTAMWKCTGRAREIKGTFPAATQIGGGSGGGRV